VSPVDGRTGFLHAHPSSPLTPPLPPDPPSPHGCREKLALLPKGFQQTRSPLADQVYVVSKVHHAFHHYLKVSPASRPVGEGGGVYLWWLKNRM